MTNLSELKYNILKYQQLHFYFYWFYYIVDIFINSIVIILLPILNFFVIYQGRYVLIIVAGLTAIQNLVLNTVSKKLEHETSYKAFEQLRNEMTKSDDPLSQFREFNLSFNNIKSNAPRIPFFMKIPRAVSYSEEELYQINRQFN